MSGHTEYVYALIISNDSEFIVSGIFDKMVRIWDVKTGNCKTMSGHTEYVYAVTISSDSEFIVSGSIHKKVRLWNVKILQCIKVFQGNSHQIFSVIFQSNNKFIISGSYDKTIRIWNVSSGQNIYTLLGHTDTVGSLSISKDNNQLVSSNGSIYSAQSSEYNFQRQNIGRLLNSVQINDLQQVQTDWNRMYAEYGLRFQNCTMSNVQMNVEEKLRFFKN